MKANQTKIIETISNTRIIPVIKLEETEKTDKLAGALARGNLPIAEVTFRASGADKVISRIKENHPEILVGAGTVLDVKQAELALGAGADFIVAPGLNEDVVNYVKSKNILMIPGCMTPSEIEKGISLGLDILKFFPAEQAGGISILKAFAAPYQNVKFIPTGGINVDNMLSYLELESVLAVGGSWMVKEKLIATDNFEGITELCSSAVKKIEL